MERVNEPRDDSSSHRKHTKISWIQTMSSNTSTRANRMGKSSEHTRDGFCSSPSRREEDSQGQVRKGLLRMM